MCNSGLGEEGTNPFGGREIAHAAQQSTGDTRSAARAAGDFARAFVAHADAEHPRAAPHDQFQLLGGVKIQPHGNAETVAQGRRQQAGPGCRADKREFGEVDLDRARRRAFADDQIELKVLHRGIEDFLHRRVTGGFRR